MLCPIGHQQKQSSAYTHKYCFSLAFFSLSHTFARHSLLTVQAHTPHFSSSIKRCKHHMASTRTSVLKYMYLIVHTIYTSIFYVHMPSRALSYKNSNKYFYFWTLDGPANKNQQWLTPSATPSRSVSSRPSRQFLEALLLRKAGQTPMLTQKHSESFRY